MHTRRVAELIIKSHSRLLMNVSILLTSLSTLASLSLNLLLLSVILLVLLLSLLLLLKLMTIIVEESVVVDLVQLHLCLLLVQGILLLRLE